ncbi:MAG: ABC transporter ATP-binding protein/permease [Oscillospiraceae bacterium]|jgi:ATP-binding cassette subfamily C protein|nr:ABC transporter ATP-binding protein/permease [Oscillospiraceae bacterium]
MKNKMDPKYTLGGNILYVLRGVRKYDPSLLAWMIMFAVFSALGSLVPVVFPKLIVDELTGGGGFERVVILSAAFSATIFITQGITEMAYGSPPLPLGSMSKRFMVWGIRYNAELTYKVITTDYANLENPAVLDMAQKARRALRRTNVGLEGMARLVLTVFGHLLTIIATVSAVFIMGWWVLLIAFAVLVVNFSVTSGARRRDKEITDELTPVNRKINYIERTASNFAYGKDIRLFSLKEFLLSRLRGEQRATFKGQNRAQKLWLGAGAVHSVTGFIQEIAMYGWLCRRVASGAVGIGGFLMYAVAIRTFSSALGSLLDDIADLVQQNKLVCDFRAFLDLPDAPSGGGEVAERLLREPSEIEFQNVSFRYPGSERYALKGISLKIKAGEKLAVVGLNGAGKSTFIKLLMRLYAPESGRILLNGADIQAYARDEYFRLFSAVFQEINMFAYTVAENVSMREYGKSDIERVDRTLELAGLSDKVSSLKSGIDTTMLKIIDLDGVELSGGETQKLALARALYKDAPFIVLDEPTAALDALAEERLYLEFDKLAKNKTAVYISHRLASTRFCDRIILFEDGKIAEAGTHGELVGKCGKYAELFNVQAQYYRSGNGESEGQK